MSNNKSLGTDNIPTELYQRGGQILHTLIKGIRTEEKVPTDWKTNITVPIHKKKGDKLQCHNYTEKSILCTAINKRLKNLQ